MKKISLLVIYLLFFGQGFCQTFSSFLINIDGAPESSIDFTPYQTRDLDIFVQLVKPINTDVETLWVDFQIVNSAGTVLRSDHLFSVPNNLWTFHNGDSEKVEISTSKIFTMSYGSDVSARLALHTGDYTEPLDVSEEIAFVLVIPPVADAGPNATIYCPESVEIGGSPTAYDGTAPYQYLWEPSTGLSSSTIANPIASPTSTLTYTLTVTDAKGLTSVDYVTVYVTPEVAPAIGGYTYMYKPCPGKISKKSFYLSAVPDRASNLTWTTSFGTITKYYYTDGLKTGVEITINSSNLPEVRKYSPLGNNEDFTITAPANFVIGCTATYPCGTTKGTKTIELRDPVCKIIPPSPDLIKPGSVEVKEKDKLQPIQNNLEANVFPNPVSSELNLSVVSGEKSSCSIKLVNQQSSEELVLDNREIERGNTNLIYNVAGLKRGIYVLVININGTINRKKIILI